MRIAGPPVAQLPSGSADLWDLCTTGPDLAAARDDVAFGASWSARWTATWRRAGVDVVSPVRDLGSVPLQGWEPVRRFAWRAGQRHRPGLQYLVSTGRHHGFERIAEQRLLLALDFAAAVVELFSQPFRLRYTTTQAGWREHIPDFLAATTTGPLLVDVRPAGRIGGEDRVAFAATAEAAEAALVAGWRYLVVTGWRAHVTATLDTLSSARRPLQDPTGLEPQLLAAASGGPLPFGGLVAATRLPMVARAHALHLIWHRRLGIVASDASAGGSACPPWADLRLGQVKRLTISVYLLHLMQH
ncbi:TnsA-like heteromeric transposase endonuclease subunit [Dactylosporangium sp. NPDC049140]|uniref:TnsA-like heteromeric transposase endonuclease subunit n=1 Tax=Dactylosporangium sp. NPDC049140 TaxID=3155647 RepID=UPI0033EDACC1